MDMLWVWTLVLATPFAIVYCLILSRWRFSKRTTLTIACGFIIGVTAWNFITIKDMFWMLTEHPQLDLACRVLNIAIETIFAFILTKQSKAHTVFIVLSMAICVYIVDTIAMAMDIWIGSDLVSLIFKLTLYTFMAFVLLRLRKTFREVAMYMKNRLWLICSVQGVLFLAGTLVVSYPIPLNLAPENIYIALMLCFVNLAVYALLIYLFHVLRTRNMMEKNAMAFHMHTSSLLTHNAIAANNQKKAAILRHDMRHITQMMWACLSNADLDGAKKLLEHLDKNINEAGAKEIIPITGHNLIDAALSFYVGASENANIQIEINICSIDEIEADKTELAVVLANALENAVNACKKLTKGEKRVIRVIGQKNGRQFFLAIANTYSGNVTIDPDTKSPITDELGHGTGTKSILYFAQKHNAEFQYKVQNGWFELRLLIR